MFLAEQTPARGGRRFPLFAGAIFDKLEALWESDRVRRITAYTLVALFVSMLLVIELRRQEVFPVRWNDLIPTSHFYAINLVFTLLLVIEVISLVFSLAHSVAEAVGKQFEILSLILLRQSFKEFVYFNEPIKWEKISEPVWHILSDAAGALLIFVALGFYYRLQKHRPITRSAEQQRRFVTAKKLLALALLIVFAGVGCHDLWQYLEKGVLYDFFDTFYTILIFGDILLVLISLRASSNYYVVFRNSGFALTTIVIRLALTAPAYVNVALGVGAAIFALGLTMAYNIFTPVQHEESISSPQAHISSS